ncbi:MAG: hypothetical protein WC821_01015 [archaeon]|jgi:hypothetical protein
MVLNAIKDIYYSLEEKWYAVIDKINTKVPIYGIVDAVDSVIPSFLLFLLIVFLLIAFGVFLLLGSNQVYDATFTFVTNDGKPVYDTLIFAKVMQGNEQVADLNSRTDASGALTFSEIKKGQEIVLDINLSKGTYQGTFIVNETLEEIVKLKAPIVIFAPVTKKVFVKSANGLVVNEEINLNFTCENSTILPTPQSAVFDKIGGLTPVEVTEPVNCKLQATVAEAKYKQKTYSVNSQLFDLYLEGVEQPTTTVKITIRSGGFPVNDASFKVKLDGKNTYEEDTKLTSQATIKAPAGTYFLSVYDPQSNYGIVSKTIEVNSTGLEMVIEVSKTVKSKVIITLTDDTTSALISGGIITVKDAYGREIASGTTDTSGTALFTFTDLGEYSFAGKKLGDTNGGYFPKEVKQQLTGDMNVTMQLEKITTLNAGKVTVKVIDQDGLAVINAKVMLKYKSNDGLVELYQAKNYSLTDLNGEATFIAGRVEGLVYAYAIKGTFSGSSVEKLVPIDIESKFNVTILVGNSTIKINAINEAGDTVDATAEILTIDGKMVDEHGLTGVIQLENGKATRSVKAAQTIYLRLKAETYETYYTAPLMLFGDKTYTFNVTMLKQISEPEIKLVGVYNETDVLVQTMAAGKKYYAKFLVNSDADYSDTLFNFRVGKETMLENDIMQIDSIQSANIYSETRGVTYDPTKGYSYDSENTTDGLAKWSNVLWKNFGKGTREVKAYFRITKTAPQNSELQFFFKGKFDNKRVPASTATQDFYADSYQSIVYYVGTESVCESGFCANSEWLLSKKSSLYVDPPYALNQVGEYNYHFTLLNNTDIDYSKTKKPIYMNITVLGDNSSEKRVKIKGYEIKDSIASSTNTREIYSANNIELNTFEKNATIEVGMTLEGVKEGADAIKFELIADGKIIYTKETNFSIVKEKDLTVSISPQFIPAFINTQIEVNVLDEKGEYVPDTSVKTFAKEPGVEQYLVDSKSTDRLGRAVVDSGALFQKTKLILEITKEGYARLMFVITVSSDTITFSPEAILVSLNTFSKREETKQITLANMSQQKMVLKSITLDAKFKDTINEDAMKAYFDEITAQERTINPEDTLDLTFLKIRLANSITQGNFIEPISITGSIKAEFEQPELFLTYDVNIPLTVNVSSEANPGDSCLSIKPGKMSATTEKAQARFDFEMINQCASNSVNIPIGDLSVTSSPDIGGIGEITIRNSAGTSVGRSALDGGTRVILKDIKAGEKLFGTITYAPGEESIGRSVSIPITLQAKFQGQTISTNPANLNYTVNVVNLKECMNITADSAPVGFKEKAKITINTSACLGQKVDVILCKNDSGCSGGAEGKITLSKKAFTIQNRSEEIEAYNPSLPGTYGITIHARTAGNAGFTYVGELPVSFTEPDGKYFNLNKFEVQAIGTGAEDSIVLTNQLLSETVNVKANGCVWGQQDTTTNSQKYMTILTGVMMGAALGNMVGMGANKTTKGDEKTEKNVDADKPTTDETGTTTQGEDARIRQDKIAARNPDNLAALNDSKTGLTDADFAGTSVNDQRAKTLSNGETIKYYTGQNGDKVVRYDGTTYTSSSNDLSKINSSVATSMSANQVDSFTHRVGNWAGIGNISSGTYNAYTWTANKIASPFGGGATTPPTVRPTGTTSNVTPVVPSNPSSPANIVRTDVTTRTSELGTTGTLVQNPDGSSSTVYPKIPQANVTLPNTEPTYLVTKNGIVVDSSTMSIDSKKTWQQLVVTQSALPDFIANIPTVLFSNIIFPEISSVAPKVTQAHFLTQGGYTAIGAVVGGIIAYMMMDEFDCSDSQYDAVVPFDDFVMLLQGTQVSVTEQGGSGSSQSVIREVPSDARALSFTLNNISPEWDFTDAQYSGDETVSLRFTNNGLSDTLPRYGTLTINANMNTHGSKIYSTSGTNSAYSSSNNDYDVLCTNSSFGNYWIGSASDAGSCSGIGTRNYSQKYHLRVITAEPTGEEAYIRKATSCYMGSLTGSTGAEALPRIKLDWDWQSINSNTCDYTNPNYIYCDATQFTIALIKKLSNLDEFLVNNGGQFSCPPDGTEQEVADSIAQLNAKKQLVTDGFVGVKDISISTNMSTDESVATVTIQNNSGSPQLTYLSYAWKGDGQPITDGSPYQWTAPVGESTVNFEATTPKYGGIYFFTAVVNGEKGNRRSVSRGFLNREPDGNCWMPQTTEAIGGLPGLLYYVANESAPTYSTNVANESELYNSINFGVYLMKDAYTEDFLRDFKQQYKDTLLQISPGSTERKIVDYLDSGKISIKKKYSGDNVIEAGLYDVWVKLKAADQFRVIDGNNTEIEITLLQVKSPSINSPFYSMPFDGLLGSTGGRQGYGSVYTNENDKEITISSTGNRAYTFYNAASNGVMNITTKTKTTFDAVNTSVATRGQIAVASVSGNQADLALTQNYATPVILKHTMDTQSGNLAFSIENSKGAISTGGNLSYWIGAAKSKDFYGSNAVEMYYNSPDYRLSKLGENVYGFEFKDATRSGSMYLKSILFVPKDESSYTINSNNEGTTIWTAANEFSDGSVLQGIPGMKYNDLQSGDAGTINTLDKLFDAVKEGTVCVSNDGSSTSFWWNPAVIERTVGSTTSMANKEVTLVGTN